MRVLRALLIALLQCRDIVRGYGGEPRHQQLPHRPAEQQTSVAPSTNRARDSTHIAVRTTTNISPSLAPTTTERRPATPSKSPPSDTTRGVKGWGRRRVRHSTKAAPPRHHARATTNNTRARLTNNNKPIAGPEDKQSRPATPDQSPQLNTTRGVKGWGQGRVRHEIIKRTAPPNNTAESPHRHNREDL